MTPHVMKHGFSSMIPNNEKARMSKSKLKPMLIVSFDIKLCKKVETQRPEM